MYGSSGTGHSPLSQDSHHGMRGASGDGTFKKSLSEEATTEGGREMVSSGPRESQRRTTQGMPGGFLNHQGANRSK